MFDNLRARQPGQPLGHILWWCFLRLWCLIWVGVCYRLRSSWSRHVPLEGPVMLVSNHQSYLDPIIVGLGCKHRQFCSMARATLFDHRLFGWFIRSLNAIPVRQGAADKAAMRRCLEVLQADQALLVFPEGARTLDGRTQPFAPGTMLLIKRARPRVVPVAIEGAFDVWPRSRKRPRVWGQIRVRFGQPIEAQALIDMGADAALQHLQQIVETMRQELS